MKRCWFLSLFLILGGCVYFNTFYYAKKSYEKAYREQKKSGQVKATGLQVQQYNDAIERASKVLVNYPHSKWVDDALFLIGQSYLQIGEYQRAERKFREIIEVIPKSNYRERAWYSVGLALIMAESYDRAIETFQNSLKQAHNKTLLGKIQRQLGEAYFAIEEYDSAIVHFATVVEHYGDDKFKSQAQFRIGESYLKLKDPGRAAEAFGGVLRYKPTGENYFAARFQQAGCLGDEKKFQEGLKILHELANDDRFYKKLGQVNLKIAEVYGELDSLPAAIALCEKIPVLFPKSAEAAQAYYLLGGLYQEKLHNLKKAKELFDKAANENRNSEYGRLAISRSKDIATLESYQKTLTSEESTKAAQSLFFLAEIYYHQFNEPDSALAMYAQVVAQHPESDFAPRALAAMGYLYAHAKDDSVKAADTYRRLLTEYPHNDCVGDAVRYLNLAGTEQDTGYAERVFFTAEKVLFQDQNVDSALKLLCSIKPRFPGSVFVPRAEFTVAWVLEHYKKPEDSSVYYAYKGVADSFPQSPYASEAKIKVGLTRRPAIPLTVQAPTPAEASKTPIDSVLIDSTRLVQQRTPSAPIPKKAGQFIYPPSQRDSNFQDKLRFRIVINFLGQVTDLELLNPSGIPEIDEAARLAVRQTEFDPTQINPRLYNTWFLYEIEVKPPQVTDRPDYFR